MKKYFRITGNITKNIYFGEMVEEGAGYIILRLNGPSWMKAKKAGAPTPILNRWMARKDRAIEITKEEYIMSEVIES